MRRKYTVYEHLLLCQFSAFNVISLSSGLDLVESLELAHQLMNFRERITKR